MLTVVNLNQLNIATRLHARAIHIAKKISHFAEGGYADGAMARWRSLHKTSVIASFLSEGDEQLSVRFSDSIEKLKAARTYVDHQDSLDFERVAPDNRQNRCFDRAPLRSGLWSVFSAASNDRFRPESSRRHSVSRIQHQPPITDGHLLRIAMIRVSSASMFAVSSQPSALGSRHGCRRIFGGAQLGEDWCAVPPRFTTFAKVTPP